MQLKGGSLLAILDLADRQADGRRRLLAELPEEVRRAVAEGLLASAWYPASLVESFLLAGTRLFGERFCHDAGRHLADFGTQGAYKAVLRDGPLKTLEGVRRLWHQYCDQGEVTIEPRGDGEAEVAISSFGASRPLCERFVGYIERLVELSGGRSPEVTRTGRALEPGGTDRWRVRWS